MVRFSKAIQRAIPQKFRRSANMHIAKNGPFCTTPKYATIVLCSSSATHTITYTQLLLLLFTDFFLCTEKCFHL